MPGSGARRQQADNSIVEREQPDRIALPVHQICQRGGKIQAVLELAESRRPVTHRGAHIERNAAFEVGLFFVFLDVKAVASCVDFPVDRGQVVTGHVLPVLGELHAEPLERAAMQAGEEPLDDGARLQLERAQSRHDRGVEEQAFAGALRHVYIPLFGTGTASRSRSMMASELMRSDSA